MKRLGLCLLAILSLAGCRHDSTLLTYWKDVPLLEDDIRVSEDRLARFAELAVQAPEKDALSAMDLLFDRLKEDEVAYYVYIEWLDAAFYSILSPCRNAVLYAKTVDRLAADGILTGPSLEPYLRKREWIGYNLPGEPAMLPGVSVRERTLVLVLDVGCSSCRDALILLADQPEWADVPRLAVCCGYGATPTVPGWEYITDPGTSAAFDPKLTPVFFVVAADGSVESTYALAL